MTDIKLKTDANGHEMVLLTDPEKYGPSKKGLHTSHIFLHLASGAVFTAPPSLRGLSRLSEAEVEMVEYWLREKGAEMVPDIFAGDPPPDG